MAGEVIHRIKQKENEAAELINKARADAKNLLQKTRAGKADILGQKDELLQKEEEKIKQKYARETAQIIEEIEKEENETIKKITALCDKNLPKVVDYITNEIVKE
jgi:vacuolar-type H+-ATPase subunit H